VQLRNRGERPGCSPLTDLLDAKFFKALCDPSRLNLVENLATGGEAQTVSQLAGCCPLDVSVVSRHLALLRDAGIVQAVRKGKEVFYQLDCSKTVNLLRAIADALESCCPPAAEKPAH